MIYSMYTVERSGQAPRTKQGVTARCTTRGTNAFDTSEPAKDEENTRIVSVWGTVRLACACESAVLERRISRIGESGCVQRGNNRLECLTRSRQISPGAVYPLFSPPKSSPSSTTTSLPSPQRPHPAKLEHTVSRHFAQKDFFVAFSGHLRLPPPF